MLTKHLTKIGDSTGIIIDRPILGLLGLERGDEVQLRVEGNKLILERATEPDGQTRRRAKFAKAKERMHGDIGDTLVKLAK
jgi:antitoxin component of MazEF toxin-antitoxin module